MPTTLDLDQPGVIQPQHMNAARVPKRIALVSITDRSLLCCKYAVVSVAVLCSLFDSHSSKVEDVY